MQLKSHFFRKTWRLTFVKGGMDALFSDRPLELDIVTNPYKDLWFAVPFVLNVTDDRIFLLVEEFCQDLLKGRIAKQTIDRHSMTIEKNGHHFGMPHPLEFPHYLAVRRQGVCLSRELPQQTAGPV